jgi:hypothetical protein
VRAAFPGLLIALRCITERHPHSRSRLSEWFQRTKCRRCPDGGGELPQCGSVYATSGSGVIFDLATVIKMCGMEVQTGREDLCSKEFSEGVCKVFRAKEVRWGASCHDNHCRRRGQGCFDRSAELCEALYVGLPKTTASASWMRVRTLGASCLIVSTVAPCWAAPSSTSLMTRAVFPGPWGLPSMPRMITVPVP